MFLTEEATTSTVDWVDKLDGLLDTVVQWATTSGIRLILSVLILFISFKIVNSLTKKIYKKLQKKNVDATIAKVTYNALKLGLKAIILVCLVGYVGIETASISALIASIGVGISLAVQGTLSNFAGGVIIILMRPFKIGDYITSNGESGTVEDIKLFYTHLVTPDNKVVMIPNGTLANNVIVNYSEKESRRVDVVMGIAYGSNVELAKKLISDIIARNELIYTNPKPFITLGNLGESSIDIYVRVWTKNSDYWTVNFYLLDEIRKAFEENGIEIPYNKLDVTILNQDK